MVNEDMKEMDDEDMRRGKKKVKKEFDEEEEIMEGDRMMK